MLIHGLNTYAGNEGFTIRRSLVAAPIIVALVAILAGAAPVAARQIALGAVGSTSVEEFTAATGQAPALWQISSKWGHPGTKNFPTGTANHLKGLGITPLIRWTPTDPQDWTRGRYERYERILNGRHDAYLRKWAQDAKAFGATVVLRFAHEPNQTYFPWAVGRFDNTKQNFKRAWRYIWRIFRQEGATNVKFLWSMATKACFRCNPYRGFYPGHSFVDYVGFSGFNWGNYRGRTWISMYRSYRQPMQRFKEFTWKPVIVAETASNHRGGNKANWIKWGYPKVFKTWPKIKAIIYLDTDVPRKSLGHPDWRLRKPWDGSAQAAYAAIAAQERFQGTIP